MMFSLLNYRPIGLLHLLSHLQSGFILNKRQVWDSQSNILDEQQLILGTDILLLKFLLALFHLIGKSSV